MIDKEILNEARQYKNMFTKWRALGHARGESEEQIHDDIMAWLAKDAARKDINAEASANRAAFKSSRKQEYQNKDEYNGYKLPRRADDTFDKYVQFLELNNLDEEEFPYRKYIDILDLRMEDEWAVRHINGNLDDESRLEYPSFYNDMRTFTDEYTDTYESYKHKGKRMHLNEMSDELLNRATISALDRGDVERALRFNAYKNNHTLRDKFKTSKRVVPQTVEDITDIKDVDLDVVYKNRRLWKAIYINLQKQVNPRLKINSTHVPSLDGLAYNILKEVGCETIGDVCDYDYNELIKQYGSRVKSVRSIEMFMEELGLEMKNYISRY